MPPRAKRRKTAPAAEVTIDAQDVSTSTDVPEQAPGTNDDTPQEQVDPQKPNEPEHEQQPEPEKQPEPEQQPEEVPVEAASSSGSTQSAAEKAKERMARFRALQARAKTSSDQNLKEATKESQRLATDPAALASLNRRRDIATHKLLKAETEEAGDDFERKRAWDWTAEESERWDKRLKKRAAHRDNNAFQDYRQESNKMYKRQVRGLAPDLERYEKDKMAAIEKAAASGGLDIIETDDGELIAVDKDGSFYSTADSTSFAQSRPDKAAVDRLVGDLQKAEETRLRKRRERMAQNGDDGDVTYINEKNKQFNQKLARFYNKYTAEIRDSFERGTMI
ncbi:SYF2 splicing factor [Hypoxylon rubiginosum]|uniref:SYF2 splicing factor n=1 Tax=Hypoxylon rubiginosum TaxID=110542 RepID=A0ACB9ZD55_9PEZI|nr:SYF2 splicing factor [Hypoxylon rubiginosum]